MIVANECTWFIFFVHSCLGRYLLGRHNVNRCIKTIQNLDFYTRCDSFYREWIQMSSNDAKEDYSKYKQTDGTHTNKDKQSTSSTWESIFFGPKTDRWHTTSAVWGFEFQWAPSPAGYGAGGPSYAAMNRFFRPSTCFLCILYATQGILAQTQPCTATMAPAVSRPPSRSSQVSSDGEGDDMGRRPSSQCVTPRVEGTGRSGSPVHRANLPFSQQSSQQRDLSRYEACER